MIKVYWPKRFHQARQVFWCESHWFKYAQNPYSGASGVPQLMPFWWTGVNAYGWQFNPHHLRASLFYAHEIFRRDHFTWGQWSCKPY